MWLIDIFSSCCNYQIQLKCLLYIFLKTSFIELNKNKSQVIQENRLKFNQSKIVNIFINIKVNQYCILEWKQLTVWQNTQMIDCLQLQSYQKLLLSIPRTSQNTHFFQLSNNKNYIPQKQIKFEVLTQDAATIASMNQQKDQKKEVSNKQYEKKIQFLAQNNTNMENIIHDTQHTQDTTLRQQEHIKIENMDIQIKQEDLNDQENNQSQLNQFQFDQKQHFYNIFNKFEMNFQIDEYALLGQMVNNTTNSHSLNLNACKLEEKNEQNIIQSNCNENTKEVKVEEQLIADQDYNKNGSESNEIQILQDFVLQTCQKYSNEYKNFKQLHRQLKDNKKIEDIINEIRQPIIIHYQKLIKDQAKAPKNFEKECRKDNKNYMNEQCHCMCSLNAKFTKLSSLHNHIKKQHNNTPVWCWQLKLSFQVGRPNKEIPKIDACLKQKKSRYDKKVLRLLQLHL
ncbi:hypothetical protein TTHERM_00024280 (macronuclear) [Tetrahymena thermophila SB210]|uniref:Uncharacterized protein n=1 Tax=Tetrahymena thermophila (strain SB210) TaxID=312017 RepID=Q22R53_TETTS|nr:hypothetical protein TTHERM_00024280 [Tetrahymena thermophila SB210]EAR88269.2 hypothetical protein TTHERM_00024280 [Tetrahymena thermophila SB210]|eukprot:XP_001008514.2 hypothetical protein TTHERM_00024280 [Tetrahymena thermophila SB210]